MGHLSYIGQIRDEFQMTLIFVDIPMKITLKTLPLTNIDTEFTDIS